MKLNRRNFLTILGGTTAAATLTSCAGTGGSTTGSSGSAGSSGADKISFWSNHPGSSKAVEQQIIDAFVAQTGIAVELVDGGSSYEDLAQKFNGALAGGDLPDVLVTSDVTWFNFALNKAITPMDDLWKSEDVDSDDYVDTLREDYTFNNQHYALPYSRSTCLFYYNTDQWSAAGLSKGPATWQEFDEMATKLLATNPSVAPLVIPDGSNYLDWYFQGMIWTFGGKYSDKWDMKFTEPDSIAAGQFLADQVKKGHIKITTDPTNEFGTGLGSALLQSTGSLGGLKKAATIPFNTAFLPGPTPGCPTGGAGLAIPQNISDDRKAAAMKFIAFMTSPENTVTFTQATGYMPVRKSAMDLPAQKSYLDGEPRARTAIEQLGENTAPQDYARVFIQGGGARIGEGLDRITTGGESVETVFAKLADDSRAVYERDIAPKL